MGLVESRSKKGSSSKKRSKGVCGCHWALLTFSHISGNGGDLRETLQTQRVEVEKEKRVKQVKARAEAIPRRKSETKRIKNR